MNIPDSVTSPVRVLEITYFLVPNLVGQIVFVGDQLSMVPCTALAASH